MRVSQHLPHVRQEIVPNRRATRPPIEILTLSVRAKVPAYLPPNLRGLANEADPSQSPSPAAERREQWDFEPDNQARRFQEGVGPANMSPLGNPSRLFENFPDGPDLLAERPNRPPLVHECDVIERINRQLESSFELPGKRRLAGSGWSDYQNLHPHMPTGSC